MEIFLNRAHCLLEHSEAACEAWKTMASALGPMTSPSSKYTAYTNRGSTHSKVSSGFVNIGTPEEVLLENYFLTLSRFRFEDARDDCEHERDSKLSGSNNWTDFMNLLSRLANAESSYFSLSFVEKASLVRRGRKEALKNTYDNLLLELRKVREVYAHGEGGTDFSWERKLAELLVHIIEFVSARREMIDFYLRFDHSDGCHLDYEGLEAYVKKTNDRFKDIFQHKYLKPVKTMFQKELGVLTDILQAQHHISEWQFLPAIIAIQACENKLTSWHGMIPLGVSDNVEKKQVQKSIRSRPHPPPSPGTIPYLYKWWCKFHSSLLAKFSLYFYGVLTEHASVYDMRHLSAKLDVDYVASFWMLIRSTSASCVCLVFDSNGLPDFKGNPKYHFPDSPAPTLTGINSYPIMIEVPHEFDFHHHRANIVSMIMGKAHQLNTSSQHVSQHDEKLHCTYYMTQVERRATLVVLVISSTSRGARDRDSKITNWMSDIASQLRNIHIASLLRPP